jgi:hypothetical protein
MLQGLSVIVAIVSVCCYFYVIYQMFDKAESVIAIVCLVGICLFGLGGIVAFVYGWIKAREWEIVPVMAVWSACVVINILLSVTQVLMGG